MNIFGTEELKDFVISALEEKQAKEIVVIDLGDRSQLAKYIIFASGRSSKNISAIAEYLGDQIKHNTNLRVGIEGLGKSEWILIDVGDIIIHLFQPEARTNLNLEELYMKRTINS